MTDSIYGHEIKPAIEAITRVASWKNTGGCVNFGKSLSLIKHYLHRSAMTYCCPSSYSKSAEVSNLHKPFPNAVHFQPHVHVTHQIITFTVNCTSRVVVTPLA